MCDGLFEQSLGLGLNTLVLWNNQITYQAMPSLARSLVSITFISKRATGGPFPSLKGEKFSCVFPGFFGLFFQFPPLFESTCGRKTNVFFLQLLRIMGWVGSQKSLLCKDFISVDNYWTIP